MKNKEKYDLRELHIGISDGERIVVTDNGFKVIVEINPSKEDKEFSLKPLQIWLEQEYKEPIKLTDDEKVILRNVDKCFRWITRDKSGYLYLWEEKPHKKDAWWNDYYGDNFYFDIYSHLFQFIKWEDEEPRLIEELLHD